MCWNHTKDRRHASQAIKIMDAWSAVIKEHSDHTVPLQTGWSCFLRPRRRAEHPGDLAERDCLVHTNEPVWRFGHGPTASLPRVRNVAYSSNSYLAPQKAAVHGRGIALLPQQPVHGDPLSGALRVVPPQVPVPDRPLYAIYGPGDATPRKVTVFLEFLTRWFRENATPAFEADDTPRWRSPG
ncbi:LysR substrate-binding domain-containing protein [Streptomyces sp. NPDC058739]|uniref:LysR substrate-binding domain-containing protein n=1 Tax=Streptomyces sp. NPDC058739 TaxID=3346618 RepID=UPI00369EB476